MKLIYQWLIVLTLAGLLYAIHTYCGITCSKNQVVPMAVNRLNENHTISRPLATLTYKVPKKKTKKKRKEKMSKQQCKDIAAQLKWLTDDPDWDFCEVKM